MIIDNGLPEKNLKQISLLLNNLLANEYILYTKTLNYHWNVTGPHFGALHKLFNDQYESLLMIIDDLAERIRSIGGHAHATLTEFIKNGTIPEHPTFFGEDLVMIQDLLEGHETIIKQLRPAIKQTETLNDMGTNNLLTDLLEKHEKMAWMLRAHLEQ